MSGLAPWMILGLEWLLKGSLILATVMAVVAIGGKAAPAWRAFLLSLGFCCLLVLPLAMRARPYVFYRVPLGVVADAALQTSAAPAGADTMRAIAVDRAVYQDEAASRNGPPWPQIVLAVWGAGMVFFTGRLWAGLHAARHLRKRARREAESRTSGLASDAGKALHLRRPVSLIVSGEVLSPAAGGIFRPCLVLPVKAGTWPADRLYAVLLHEFAHIKRWDVPCQLLARLAAALCWFNPLVWLALRRLRTEQEMACDDLVLAHGIKTTDYAGHLLHILRVQSQAGQAAPAAMAGGASIIERRIRRMLMPGRTFTAPHRGTFRFALVMVATGFALLCGIGFGAAAQQAPPAEAKRAFTNTFTLWPLTDGFRISSGFGPRKHPLTGEMMPHSGIDLAVKTGTPVRAVSGGTVVEAGWKGAYGYCVILEHAKDLSTLYAKLSAIRVVPGRDVAVGEAIALSGHTGVATGPHLHFEVRESGRPADPLTYLPNRSK